MCSDLMIDSVCVPSGQKMHGTMTVPGTDGYTFPAVLINGREDGSVFLATAGVHGAEYPGIQALLELGREIDPQQVHGAILLIPIVNTPAFYQRRAYVCPADEENKNFNRIFPGRPDGTVADRVAYYITKHFVSKCDFHVDLHSGDIVEYLEEFCIVANAPDPKVLEMCTRAAQHTCFPCRINSRGTAEAYNRTAIDFGKPALLFERGCAGLLRRSDVERDKADVLSLLRFMGNLPDQTPGMLQPDNPQPTQVFYPRHQWDHAGYSGCFYKYAEAGDHITKGQEIGRICDLSGNVLETFTAQFDGILKIAVNTLGISKGDDTFMYVG